MFAEAVLPNAEEKLIAKKKYVDLMALLEYIPEKYHNFYKHLKCEDENNDEDDNDYGLASASECNEPEEDASCKFLNSYFEYSSNFYKK